MKALGVRGVIERTDVDAKDDALPDSELIHYLATPSEKAAKSTQHAGHLTGVNERYVSYAKKVKRQAPDAFEAMRAGTITIHQARVLEQASPFERA